VITNPRRTNPPIPYEAPQLGGMRVLRGFRPVTQLHEHTCGPACLRAILAWNSVQVREADLAVQAKTNPRHGTTPEDMALTLTDHGRRVTLVKNTDLAWCLRQLRRDRAVLLLWNDWKGHWVTLIGYDPKTKRLLLADPANRKTGLRVHTYATLAKHWKAKVAGTLYRRLAIAVA
jgi:ABC-type bacteriocin/lantibiotic exporter with double-glycine peptidase domain